ncbi:MAG: lamin tail domain-containing protein [Verrucomicrobia bacterium]|nr:lamin tail domain-containing protein [Verrucomicrobiota bacterium]
MSATNASLWRLLAVLVVSSLTLTVQLPAQDLLRISEFMAVNDGPLADENGDNSDWIEIHNAGTNTVNLDGWYLTDAAGNLTKWKFPATNLPPNSYLIVFASNKNRRTPGAPLHTNFRLDANGEYLGLVKADGSTVVSAYVPAYPPQVGHISFGIPMQQASVTLLATGAAARFFVPSNDAHGFTWTSPGFDDSTWWPVTTGVGYETDGQGPFTPAMIADSVADFAGRQGSNNWFYGYWNKGADADGAYADGEFVAFPNAGGPYGETNFWDGTRWHWFAGDPPYTSLTADGGHPNADDGVTGRANHWAVRRYVAESSGPLKITGHLEHRSGWVYVSASGVCANSAIYVYPTAAGDGYIDDMKLVAGSVAEAGPNLLPNGEFESAIAGPWTVSANLTASVLATDVKHGGNSSLHFMASAGGSTSSSAIWQTIAPALTVGQTYTLSYWYLPGTNPVPPLVVRFSGNWINTSPAYCGDGVIGRIFVDGTQVFQRTAFVSSSDFSVTVPANLGSRIDFALDAGTVNNDFCDASTFTAKVETADPSAMVAADSVADWSFTGVQGEKNWFYGYYNRTADADQTYQATNFTAFPRDNGAQSAQNFWTGVMYDWFNGNPPWDEIGQTSAHPNGVNNAAEHWVIRRWVSKVAGRVTVDWTLAKANPAGSGVTGRLFVNGAQKDFATIAGADSVGVSRSVIITNVQVGDFIDLALDPTGTGGATDDSADGSTFSMVIRGAPTLAGDIASNVESLMKGVNSTAYLRVPFVITNPASINYLTLRMKYDDGFVAYLNGVGVASRNSPEYPDAPAWNSTARASHSDLDATQFEDFDLTSVVGLLQPGTNILALHGLNASANDSDFLVAPELKAVSLIIDPATQLYFSSPSPGSANGFGNTNLGPLITSAAHEPKEPKDHEDLYVTAQVMRTFNPISAVRLTYRTMFAAEATVPMLDDGLHADGLAGDGLYGGVIPASAAASGQMVRYFVSASDARTNNARFPAYTDTVNSPQYFGTVVFDPTLTNPLPVLHWFIQNPGAADNTTGTKCSLFFLGRFYDNLTINLHGQSSSGFPKKSYDVDLNPGYGFVWKEGEDTVDDLNFLSTWADKSHMRNMLAHESYRDADAPYHWVFPIRVQQNGAFFSVANLMENGDEGYVKRLGLDPRGSLYKMYNTFQAVANATIGSGVAEKKTRKWEGNADLIALFNGLSLSGQSLINYIFDNIDVPETVNFLAGHVLQNDEDCCHKNYYFYRDSEGTGQWQIMPWDVDLSFGHTWTDPASGGYAYYDPRIYATNRYSQTTLGIGTNNKFPQQVLSIPWVYQMYLRRVRTITDQQLQPPTTHPYLLHYESKVNRYAAQLAPDAALDFAKWVVPNYTTYPPTQSLAQAVHDLNVNYFPLRRQWIYTTLVASGSYIAPQPTNATVLLGQVEYNPASGDQAQEYIQLRNTNSYSVDLSGWRLTGAVDYKFKGGVVIPTNGTLYVSPDVNAFRARTSGPRGGQGLFVQGNYQRQLSARGEAVQLVDATGRLVAATNYPGTPSLPQQYLRITEIMYHPAVSRPADGVDPERFEYIELKNIGPVALSLIGVHFTNGIDFAFTGASAVTSLAAGESVLVVHDLASFTARYGGGLRIAGQFTGALDNNGEALRLDDAGGEKILDFRYENQWYPITDGFGFSLVAVNENAPWDTWGFKTNWIPSGVAGGSPGVADPAPLPVAPILINEVLTHTDPPQVDAIELHNPTTKAVEVGGWLITDDSTNAFKFRLPAGTTIPAGGYVVFTETEFNPAGLGFAFSSKGDEVYLLSSDGTNLTGYIHGFQFGAAENGVSFGRHVTSLGEEHFVAQSALTLTNANSGPKVGPVVISEIMFHPPDGLGGLDNQDDEFIELRNITGAVAWLYDTNFPTNTWHLRGGVDFDLPQGVSLAANGSLLLVSFDPTNAVKLAAIRARYGLSTNLPVFGPYAGKLDNSADTVRLTKPDAPDPDGSVAYIVADEVAYRDSAPWPVGADGSGASLQRVHLDQYADDPVNWAAGAPNAGGDFTGGTPPVITAQPTNLAVVAFSPATFTVGATGSDPLRFQWQRNGVNLPDGTNAALVVVPEPLDNATFSVAVFNSAGAAVSSNAALTVLVPAAIFTQPQGRAAFPNTNVSFFVVAGSTSPMRYQWRLNGVDILNATNATYTIPLVQPSHDGDYTVVVTDDAGSVVSAVAHLTVTLHPLFTLQPTNRIVSLGATPTNITMSAAAISTTPVRYQWRFNGLDIPNATSASYTITNAQTADSGDYSVLATDSYGSFSSTNGRLSVVTRPVVIQQPTPRMVVAYVGDTVSYTVAVSNTATLPVGYRWRRNGSAVATNLVPSFTNTLTLAGVQLANAGAYDVAITNLAGPISPATTARGFLVVMGVLADRAVPLGSNATFNLVITNGNPSGPTNTLNYAWWFQATNRLASGTNLSFTFLTVSNVQASNFGPYTVVITNAAGISATQTATLSLALPPVITEQPTNQTVSAGADAAFTVTATGSAPLGYQWWFNGTNLVPGGATPVLTLSNAQPAQAGGYQVIVSNIAGSATSQVATLTVMLSEPPRFDGIIAATSPTEPVTMSFTAQPGQSYSVLYSDTITNTAWLVLTNIGPLGAAQPVTARDVDVVGKPQRFYRIVTPAQP